MSLAFAAFKEKSRLKALLDRFSIIDDPREPWRIAHPLRESLLLVVCASMADCDLFDSIAAWGKANIGFLRRYLFYEHGAPRGRWLTLLMNRVDPALFSAAFATTRRLMLGQEAVEGKSNALAAIPVLLDRLSDGGSLKGALVPTDAIATNAKIAQAIVDKGADYPLAVKANQPTLRAEVESAFAAATRIDTFVDLDKGHGRIEQRSVGVLTEVDWLNGERRFPGEMRLPRAMTIIRVKSRAELADRSRFEIRYYISFGPALGEARGRGRARPLGIENQLHGVLDVVFAEDQSRLRKGHGARNMSLVRHFAVNLVRTAPEPERRPPMKPQRKAARPKHTSIKLRKKNRQLAKQLSCPRLGGFSALTRIRSPAAIVADLAGIGAEKRRAA